MPTSALLLAALALTTPTLADDPPPLDFDREIAPLLARHCLDCHSGADPKGKLDLSRKAPALKGGESGSVIEPGDPDASLLVAHVDDGTMPPMAPLPNLEKAALRRWIAAGAPWGTDPIDPYQATTDRRAGRDWWSLQPLQKPTLPPATNLAWVRNPIDRFILARLDSTNLAPAPEADRRTLARRLAFDLTGLPPSHEEIETFLNDTSADAYERLVDRLLASPQYGARWARRWLDLARFGESHGFEYDEFRPSAYRYRDWVVEALNADLPYDQFSRLQLAGDTLDPENPGAIAATGFLVAGAYDTAGQNQQSLAMRAVVRQDELEDIVGTVGQTFLGLTLHCARCHDHKFDPIRQSEYYGVASALSGVRHGERELPNPTHPDKRARLTQLRHAIDALEAPAIESLQSTPDSTAENLPRPLLEWNLTRSAIDRAQALPAQLFGKAALQPAAGGLVLDGTTAYLASAPLPTTLKAKTLEARVRLANLDQRGGAVVGVQHADGSRFDAIVFGEQEPGLWMPGSDGFARTQSLHGPQETEADHREVHLALVYDPDGTIRLYRDGQPYGAPYKSSGPATFEAGRAQLVVGLRHSPVSPSRLLAGTVGFAALYDRALAPAEIALLARHHGKPRNPDQIAAALPPEKRDIYKSLLVESEALASQLSSPAPRVYAVSPRQPEPTQLLLRGNPAQPAEVVPPGGVAAIVGPSSEFRLPPDAPESERRASFAAWVASPQNPLFARVAVNRLWQAHFGAGLVETPSDFGFNGGRPSHPELLDWLASQLISSGWSQKAIHRLIVTSATYRQSAAANPDAMKIDAANRLLWRHSPQRLEAEMVRDAMLAAAGQLDPTLGGPSYQDYALKKAVGTSSVHYLAVDPAQVPMRRRTLYRAWTRGGRSNFLDSFDCPDPSTTLPRRAVTTTPIQALALLNNAVVLHLSSTLAQRVASETSPDPESQVDRAYQLVLSRRPTPDERAEATQAVRQFGLPALARALFNSNEFVYVD